jgi:hypothetical protein
MSMREGLRAWAKRNLLRRAIATYSFHKISPHANAPPAPVRRNDILDRNLRSFKNFVSLIYAPYKHTYTTNLSHFAK